MIREFVHLHHFEKSCKALGLSDEELRSLENMILENPDSGELIQGTGGLRKTRAGIDNRGKSGGIRVLYVDFEFYEKHIFYSLTLKMNWKPLPINKNRCSIK